MDGAVFLTPIVDIFGNISSGFVHGGSKKKQQKQLLKTTVIWQSVFQKILVENVRDQVSF